ncbi:SAM-dependent methyltransferase [Alkalihalobacillus sp. LMS39]|uniref:SAM-dependent methyltransferase n=1 Tax=Alkalihalobacillus sp. LMS39 TaxID=2924032 RepID=UPI001FB3F03E|nr:SAM-dependent methyltransferase [Alkalihalobacillus sp. LMS39]UOE95846.1 SAM-dependent methyltransferase [Alkalihalobacillus sp. LMS39]
MITLQPVGIAYNERVNIQDDNWGIVDSKIVIDRTIPEEALAGIEHFSHLEIIYYFHKVKEEKIELGARHPRNNLELPKVGIFAQRGKNRPNRLGLTTVRLLKREGRELYVQRLDCLNETPILDIKPVMEEFLPTESIKQPAWTRDIMERYWE